MKQALEIVGTKMGLALALGISKNELEACMAEEKDLPTEKYFEALDIVAKASQARGTSK